MAWAQKPSFEAASIKPNASGKDGGSIGPRGAALLATNVTLESLLVYAYSPPGGLFLRQQIISGPAWMGTDRFDIEAKTGENEHVPNTQMRVMMQSLLEDRFQLKAHRETRELPVYDLVPIKGGPQLSADQAPPDPRQAFIHFGSAGEPLGDLPRGAMRMVTGASSTTLTGTAISVARVISLLQGKSGRIIVNKTGFTGLIDVHLEFSPDLGADAAADNSTAPSLFTAIQEIGLKLDSGKAPLEVLVIDVVKRPSGN